MPSKPAGRTRRIIINMANSIASVYGAIAGIELEKLSIIPSSIPPSIAPGTEPIPPITAAVNALIPGFEPNVGNSDGDFNKYNALAIAARTAPIKNVIVMMLFTLMIPFLNRLMLLLLRHTSFTPRRESRFLHSRALTLKFLAIRNRPSRSCLA